MGHPRNYRELDTERKKLKRELDKLHKAHTKTTKTLDDFLNEHGDEKKLIDDEILQRESTSKNSFSTSHVIGNPDMDSFPGPPSHSRT